MIWNSHFPFTHVTSQNTCLFTMKWDLDEMAVALKKNQVQCWYVWTVRWLKPGSQWCVKIPHINTRHKTWLFFKFLTVFAIYPIDYKIWHIIIYLMMNETEIELNFHRFSSGHFQPINRNTSMWYINHWFMESNILTVGVNSFQPLLLQAFQQVNSGKNQTNTLWID